jgi:outer membrane receptor protein involved in Fe transport
VPSEDAGRSIPEFARQAQIQIIAPGDQLHGLVTPPIKGPYDVFVALDLMLKGTGLEVSHSADGIVTISLPEAKKSEEREMSPSLKTSTSLLALLLSFFSGQPASAQSASGSSDDSQRSTESTVESVVVTGSRVISSITNSPTPLTVVTTDQLAATTPSNVPDALNKLPVFLGSQSGRNVNNASNNSVGNVLNLRNFGIQRTLVLLDGHRVAQSNANGTVDVDNLPQMLMQRVDVVTGGASAVYGSDAVTGVVNFILNKNFEGVKYEAGAGTNNEGYGTQYKAGVALGTSLFGGRGHLEGSIHYFHQDQILMNDMPYAKNGQAWTQTGAGTAASPYTNVQFGRLLNQPFNGAITCAACTVNGQTFTANGVIGPLNPGTPTLTLNVSNGGDGSYDVDSSYQASLRSAESFARFSYDLDDKTSFYVQGIATESGNYAVWYPDQRMNPGANHPNTFFKNNPFLPATAQAQLGNNGTFATAGAASNTFQLSRVIQTLSTGDVLDQNRSYATGSVDRYLSIAVGLDGQIANRFDWDLYYSHGESRQDEYNPRNTNQQRAYAQSDAVMNASGQVQCYAATQAATAAAYADCVPINPFGPTTITPSAYDYAVQRTSFVQTNILDDVGGSISGSIFDLPAGPVKAALSAEARWLSYAVNSTASPTATVDCTGLRICSSATPLWVQNVVASVAAANNVYEFAGEINVPILKDLPLVQDLSADIAGRFTNYSTSGDAETWKLGLNYHVDDNIRFRGTMSVDIRAPTLNDLFSPLQSTISGLTDLISGVNGSALLHSQGNSSLQPEVAHTYTAGMVFTPDFVPGLTASVDYYRVNLSHGITNISYGTQAIQQICIASIPSGNLSPFCALANRPIPIGQPGYNTSANYPTFFISQALNSASVKTEGLDTEVDYGFDLSAIDDALPGSINMRGLLSLQPYLQTQTFIGQPSTWTPMPKGRFTAFLGYQVGSWGINLQDTYLSSFNKQSLPTQVYAVPKVGAYNQLDVTLDKKFAMAGDSMVDFYVTVQNVANKQYPIWPTITSNPGLFYPAPFTFGNSLGRYFQIGVRGNF